MPHLASDLNSITHVPIAKIPASGIRAFADKIADIPDLIKLTLVEPDLNTSDHFLKAALISIMFIE